MKSNALRVRLASAVAAVVLAVPVLAQSHPEPGLPQAAAVRFHRSGALPIEGPGYGHLSNKGEPVFAGHPLSDEGYRLEEILPGGQAVLVLPEPVAAARVSPLGYVAISLTDGRLFLREPRGTTLQLLSASAYAPVWNARGDSLCFVERMPRAEGDESTLPETMIRRHDAESGATRDILAGRGDSYPVMSPDDLDVVFLSVRSGIASFWIVASGGGTPAQLTNRGTAMDASFVPVPSGDPVWESGSDRICYPIDYGGRKEIWCLDLAPGRSRAAAGRLAEGSDMTLADGVLEFTVASGERRSLRAVTAGAETLDFGARSNPGNPGANVSLIESGGITFGIWSPVKAAFPHIYQGFHCGNSHPGHDFSAPRWTQIYAASDGFVKSVVVGLGAGSQVDFGNHMVIEHPIMRLQTLYAHLENGSVWTPGPGTFVGAGMPIGRAGDSGSANNIPHLHFGLKFNVLPSALNSIFQSIFGGTFLGNLPWVDMTPLYACDALSTLPADIGMGWVSWEACGLIQYPAPCWRFTSTRDVEPPETSDFRVFRTTPAGTATVQVHVECSIEDPSGVYDDATWPTSQSPMSRGVFLVLNPPFSDAIVPMSRISGSESAGVYRTDHDISIPPPRPGDTWDFTFMVHAQDRAMEGFAFANIGNGGTSQQVFVSDTTGAPLAGSTWTEIPLRDVGISILSAPAYAMTGGIIDVTVRVTNHSAWPHSGGTGRIGLNPTLDRTSPIHVELDTFSLPALAPGAHADLPLTMTVPTGLLLMPQHLIAYARGTNDPEWRNSSDRQWIQVVPPRPDLEVTSVSVPSVAGHSTSFPITFTVRNRGVLPVFGGFGCAFWLSLDTQLGNGNEIPMGVFHVNPPVPLDPGQSRTVTAQSNLIPSFAVLTGQHFFVCVDSAGVIVELDETNNCRHVPMTVGGPDFVVTDIDAPADAAPGEWFLVQARIRNQGPVRAFGAIQVGAQLSLDSQLGNGNDLPMGQILFQLPPGGLDPGEDMPVQFQTLPVPGLAILGTQHLFVVADVGSPPCGAICEIDESNNAASRPLVVALSELAVSSLTLPAAPVLGGIGSRNYIVTVTNNGPGWAHAALHVTIGNPTLSGNTVFVDVGPHQSVVRTVSVLTPPVSGPGPHTVTLPVLACAEWNDPVPGNNCRSQSMNVQFPYWDLRFQIVNAPSSANRGSSITWRVRVENVGNLTSGNVCFQTGINSVGGSGNWGSSLGLRFDQTPNLAPGAVWYYNVNSYGIPAFAWVMTQYVKVETQIGPCNDLYFAGNYHQRSIQIQ